MSKKLVVVLGATGKQGGSVVNALLENGKYAIRALTRDPTSASSKALADKGVEVVQASLTDKDSLKSAFTGAYAVFGVTIPFTADSETEQGKNIVNACLANSVPLLVWTSLPSADKLSGGKYKIPLYDEKAAVEVYIQSVHQPAVILHTGSFTENMINHGQLRPSPTNAKKWEIHFPVVPPDYPIPFSYIEKDMGPSVLGIVEHWEDEAWKARLSEKPIPMCSYLLTGKEMEETLARVSGKEVVYIPEVESLPPALRYGYAFFMEHGSYPGPIPPTILQELGVKFHTFEDYAREKVVPYMKSKEA